MKEEVPESGGASRLLVMIDNEDLYKTVSSENSINITIPVAMISRRRPERP